MAKRLVKYLKNPRWNFLIWIGLFFLYKVNHRYVGLDFLNENLDNLFNLFPLFLFILLCLNLWLSKKDRLLLVSQILILLFVGLFYLVGALTWASEEKNTEVGMEEGVSVELITTKNGRDHYLMQENQFSLFLVKKQCLYSFSPGPSVDLEKVDNTTLRLRLALKSTSNESEVKLVEPSEFSRVYVCDGGSGMDVDPYYGLFEYWIRFFSIPFSMDEFDPSKY